MGRSEPQTEEDILRRIVDERIYKGQCGSVVAKEEIKQMREEGKSYWNEMDDHVSSYSKTYSFNKWRKSYTCHVWDNVIDV